MTTHWMDNGAEGWMVPAVLDVSGECCMPDAGEHGEHALIFSTGPSLPDRVRLPAKLGGDDLRVINSGTLDEGIATCANCGDTNAKPMLELEQGYGVAQCQRCGQYNWFRKESP